MGCMSTATMDQLDFAGSVPQPPSPVQAGKLARRVPKGDKYIFFWDYFNVIFFNNKGGYLFFILIIINWNCVNTFINIPNIFLTMDEIIFLNTLMNDRIS